MIKLPTKYNPEIWNSLKAVHKAIKRVNNSPVELRKWSYFKDDYKISQWHSINAYIGSHLEKERRKQLKKAGVVVSNPVKKKETYDAYLKSPRWKALRTFILERDSHRCVTCNTTEDLRVHHRTYVKKDGEWEKYDLYTLCQECHNLIHRNRKIDGKIRGK